MKFTDPYTPNCLTDDTGILPIIDKKTKTLLSNKTNIKTIGLTPGYLCYLEIFSDFYIYGDPHLEFYIWYYNGFGPDISIRGRSAACQF